MGVSGRGTLRPAGKVRDVHGFFHFYTERGSDKDATGEGVASRIHANLHGYEGSHKDGKLALLLIK